MKYREHLACALVLAAAAPAWSAGAATPAAPIGCLIEPQRTSEVGSPVVGVVEQVHVERGDAVRKGQPLATLRADVEKVSVTLAQTRAAAVGELRAAQANADLARQKLARAEDLARQQFISAVALDQARAEASVADNRLAQAREQQGIYAHEHELARAQLGLRTIRSPADGVVAERYVSPGERVEEKPMFRVASVDPLRVEVVLPVALFSQVQRGSSVTVLPEFPGATARKAKVVVVDRLVEGASNTFRARLDLPNPDQTLPAGIRCKAELGDVDVALQSRTPSAARANVAPAAVTSLPLRLSATLAAPPQPKP